ncbi:MAG: tRNA (adenosine(37)-N6)-dimethylallyltransferase MiaA [Proteobacteria bacterium]|nr:tRNA (adenosine(37)-N6)-dimethylallyltransferase MiaA [Pseudomonadota bacterium]
MVTARKEGKQHTVIVGGPTASGKSAAALAIAREFDGVVINADSMQVYAELRVLTARPSREDEAAVPHRLYGIWKAAEHGTVGRWREAALAEIAAANAGGRLAVICGGTGMYLKLLVEGLSAVPPIPADVREASRALLAKLGPAEFFEDLKRRDAAAGAKLRVADTQRVLRAWEVVVATGVALSAHQAADPPRNAQWPTLVFLPPRAVQVAAIDARAARMVEAGALDEVRDLLAQGLSDELPAMRALGVRELAGFLRGAYDLPSAIKELQAATRKFAKRQTTWFKGQVRNGKIVCAQYSESLMPEIRTFIKEIR